MKKIVATIFITALVLLLTKPASAWFYSGSGGGQWYPTGSFTGNYYGSGGLWGSYGGGYLYGPGNYGGWWWKSPTGRWWYGR